MFGFSLSELAIKAILLLGLFLAGLGTGVYVTHGIDGNQYKALELSYKDAEIKAIQKAKEEQQALDLIAVQAAKKEATTQAALTAKAQRQLAEVSKHVKDLPNNCISFGLVRVLDAAVHGVLADSLALPTGKSDAACTGLSAADLARSIVANYNNFNANKEQLNALIAVLRAMHDQQTKR